MMSVLGPTNRHEIRWVKSRITLEEKAQWKEGCCPLPRIRAFRKEDAE